MNQKEWLEYFETINDRKPTPAEMAQAKANGDFIGDESQEVPVAQAEVETVPTATPESQVLVDEVLAGGQHPSTNAPKKKVSKKVKIIIGSLIGLVALLLVSVGGYTIWRYQAGKIPEGTYQLSSYRYYDDDKDKMVDGIEDYRESKLEPSDFIVIKGNEAKYHTYTKTSSSLSSAIVEPMDYNNGDNIQIDSWNRVFKPIWSLAEYKKELNKSIDSRFEPSEYVSESDIQDLKDSYIDSYKEGLKHTPSYSVKGDKLTLTRYDEDGKVSSIRVFKRLSKEATKKLNYDYDKAVEKDKELYNSK